MKVEIRADSIRISGYVNAVLRESRPVITPRGKVNEIIEERAFSRALEKNNNTELWLDHNPNRVIANTKDGSLELREDNIGLHANVTITDKEVIDNAKKLKGWSFGLKNPVDKVEERVDKLPLRRISEMVLDHVALILNKQPAYSSTSIELRADDEEPTEIEMRAAEEELIITETKVETPNKEPINYSQYENRILEIKVGL